jgi:nondiscriminating glutamyl-tRNA synthetase
MNLVRTRFAPSPTGIMHIGNVRAALLNYLFAQQSGGTFLLRIEDTDAQRNIANGTESIIKHLNWLGLTFSEGPQIGGKFGPYFQSQRFSIYQEELKKLATNGFVYRCFCTPEELETRRNRQIAMKRPPRYESICLKLTPPEIQAKLDAKTPHIWRMKVDSSVKVFFKDMARGILEFDLQHFSDFPLTREDGSFTFIFANCVDDAVMKISHVFRGEEHLSNTVSQTVLYQAMGYKTPIFWHLPILCNQEGKKLSKRDKGFSLDDVQSQGFLPETVCNYLAILGTSFEKEIMSLDELAKLYKFDHLHGISQIRYDVEKLKWMNHKWIATYNIEKLTELCKPFLAQAYDLSKITDQTLISLIKLIQNDLHTLDESVALLKFYFEKPKINAANFVNDVSIADFQAIATILKNAPANPDWNNFLKIMKEQVKAAGIADKSLYATLRILLTGSAKGMQLNDLFTCLGQQEFYSRLQK